MKFLKSVSLLFAAIVLLSSCQKDEETQSNTPNVLSANSTRDLVVPNGFNFETTEEINLNLDIEDAPLSGKYLLKVYTTVPHASASPLRQMFLANGAALNTQVTVPSSVDQLYLVVQSPDGSSFMTVLPKNQTIAHTFYQRKQKMGGIESSSPDCNSGCDVQRTHSGNWTATKQSGGGDDDDDDTESGYGTEDDDDDDDGETVYCVTGAYNGTGGITIRDRSIVRLCGSGTIPNITVNEGIVQVVSGANVTVNNFNLNSSSKNELIVYSGGSLTITNWFTPNADVTNYGTVSVAAMNVNSGCDLENHGSFTVTGNSYSTFNGDVDNYGTFTVNANASINGGSDFKNYCGLYFLGDLISNGDIDCRSYTKIGGKYTINGGAKHKMKNGAMAVCEDLMLNGKIEGSGSTNLFKVNDRSDANGGAQIKKNVEFCDVNGIENIASNIFKNGAKESCSLVINPDACNPEGNGVNIIQDADGDGVADEIDAYPNDPSRAADSYFPGQNSYGTLAYEDLWPAFGDYDFNDLVVDYRYQQVLNADNNVVDLKAKFVTRAMGGSLKNGFGIQLDVAQNAVSSVNGARYFNNLISNNANGTENGQTKAVVIVYDDASQVLLNANHEPFVNTVSTGTAVDPDTTEITINFGSPQTIAALGTAPYNPFIFVDQTRGREVHLAGQAPTSLADASLFGTIDDNTNPNSADNTYKSENNLPWAIHVVGGFAYPEERTDISQAYNFFSVWAQSGGVSNQDWYQDQPGYINSNDLFQ